MKWMGGWSQADLDEADPEIVAEIIQMINEEAEERAAAISEMKNR